ncbi:MAG TPA: histidine kinase [Gaiellaceae bacterium]
MRQAPIEEQSEFEGFLWGELILVALLGAALALFLTKPTLRSEYHLPELRLVLATLYAVGGGLVALLCAGRFGAEGRRFDLLLCAGFCTTSAAWAAFSVGPSVTGLPQHRAESWAGLIGILGGFVLIAGAPFARGRVENRRTALVDMCVAIGFFLLVVWGVSRAVGAGLPDLQPAEGRHVPNLLTAVFALLALVNLVAVVGFGNRFRNHTEDLDRWLALGSTLLLFASIQRVFSPLAGTAYVSQGDFLRLIAYSVLLVGVWRAIRGSEFRRAVAEERARVAREIHDGLAQYLFAVTTQVSLLEGGADQTQTLPRLKEAALAAQQEARFAVLALSSASGGAPFDAALRRYVDFLTADGELEVELEIDTGVHLAPDEQIEVFRIVQEGLSNTRRHAGARKAWLTIARRGVDRLVSLYDDGTGFEPPTEGAGQGLRNMRARAAAIGGAFTMRSVPGRGTSLEVVLRP